MRLDQPFMRPFSGMPGNTLKPPTPPTLTGRRHSTGTPSNILVRAGCWPQHRCRLPVPGNPSRASTSQP